MSKFRRTPVERMRGCRDLTIEYNSNNRAARGNRHQTEAVFERCVAAIILEFYAGTVFTFRDQLDRLIERFISEEEPPQELQHPQFIIFVDYLDMIIHCPSVRLVGRVGQLK